MEIVRTFVQHQGLRLDDRHDHLDDQPGDDRDHDDHLDDETDYNYDGDRGDYEHICPTPRFETGS